MIHRRINGKGWSLVLEYHAGGNAYAATIAGFDYLLERLDRPIDGKGWYLEKFRHKPPSRMNNDRDRIFSALYRTMRAACGRIIKEVGFTDIPKPKVLR